MTRLTQQQVSAISFVINESTDIAAALALLQDRMRGVADVIAVHGLDIVAPELDFSCTRDLLTLFADCQRRMHYSRLFPGLGQKVARSRVVSPQPVGPEAVAV